MRRISGVLACVAGVLTAAAIANEPSGSFQGDWRTTKSLVKLEQKGDAVAGSFGTGDRFLLKGSVRGNMLTFEYEEDQARGDGRFILDASGNAFTGSFQIRNGRRGYWNGWRPDPKAPMDKPGTYAGLWLTNLGLMELTQDGANFEGRYAARGTSKIRAQLSIASDSI